MTRTGAPAIDYARGRVGPPPPPPTGMPDSGLCLQFVRSCFDVASRYASAIDAWNAAAEQHPGDRNPPPAVPLYFATPSVYDHVVFGGDASGEIVTTFNADVRRYTAGSMSGVIDAICRDFDGVYLGWAADINGVRVLVDGPAPTPPPEPPKELLDVTAIIRFVDTGEIEYLSESGVTTPAATTEEVFALQAALRLPDAWVDLDSFQWTRVHQAAGRILEGHRVALPPAG